MFSGHVQTCTGSFFDSLRAIGIGVTNHRMAVTDPDRLNAFAGLVRSGKAQIPNTWLEKVRNRLGRILVYSRTPAAEAVAELLQYYQMRHTAGRTAGAVGSGELSLAEEAADVTTVVLTPEQQHVLDLALKGYSLYIGGNAGTGKTVLLTAIKHHLGKIAVAMTATTGVAGCHIHGSTFHNAFGVNVRNEFHKPRLLTQFDCIVIDEISMMEKDLFEEFDRQLRQATGQVGVPFGGVQIILCGDFLQLGAIHGEPVFLSPVFQSHFVHLKLVQQVRQSEHPEFADMLRVFRRGIIPDSFLKLVRMGTNEVQDGKRHQRRERASPSNQQASAGCQ